MSASLRATDPRAREVRQVAMTVTGSVPGLMAATMTVWFRDGSHWAATFEGPTVYAAAAGVFSLAREEGAE